MTRLFYLAVATQFVFACSLLPAVGTRGELTTVQAQSVRSSTSALQKLKQTDALVRLDNRRLATEISSNLRHWANTSDRYGFQRLELKFGKQTIVLEAILNISDPAGNHIATAINGDVVVGFTDNQLEWFPRFHQLQISTEEFTFAGQRHTRPFATLQEQLLKRLKADIAASLLLHLKNVIPLVAVPLGRIEVGAILPGLGHLEALQSAALSGVFIVAGSAMLIEKRTTSIALDLEYIPNLSNCPAEVTVTRAGFASDIKGREPIGLAPYVSELQDVHYFYSEIAGAKKPMAIIHYWFEDGKPLAVQNLPIGPSQRWRTWSSKVPGHAGASHWEVLVVEKESGCILHTQTLGTLTEVDDATGITPPLPAHSFSVFRDAFIARTRGFPITHEKPKVVQVEVRRDFLENVLQTSVAELQLEATFDTAKLPPLRQSASLRPFATTHITCEPATCPPAPACSITAGQCKRLRDTRDCSSCLFRNPLNNRCVSKSTDPFCEAARKRQNDKYEAERTRCIASAEATRHDCEALWLQIKRSCEIESGFEQSSCEAVKTEIESLASDKSVATASATARLHGSLRAVFSNFSIENDFSRLKLDLALNTNLTLDGNLKFAPTHIPQMLSACISAWHAPFAARVIPPASASSMLSSLFVDGHGFTSNWSGYILPVVISPTPLESVFRKNPHLLANCTIRLTSHDVEQVLQGAGEAFYNGHLALELQPLPTRITLAPASIAYSAQRYYGEAVISASHISYTIDKKGADHLTRD